jgi:hypothetical protein
MEGHARIPQLRIEKSQGEGERLHAAYAESIASHVSCSYSRFCADRELSSLPGCNRSPCDHVYLNRVLIICLLQITRTCTKAGEYVGGSRRWCITSDV